MSSEILSDQELSTTVITDIIAPQAIRKEHNAIGADMVQRVQMMLDRHPTIEAYSIMKDWSGKPKECLKLKLDKAVVEITLCSE
jgi:hypothetical protein